MDARAHLAVIPFGGSSDIPDESLVRRLALYYDSIIIRHPEDVLNPWAHLYRKRGYQRMEKHYAKRYMQIKEWIDEGIVKMLKADSNSAKLLNAALDRDLSDRQYQNLTREVYNKHKYYYLATFANGIRSKWIKEIGGSVEAYDEFTTQSKMFGTNWALLAASVCGPAPLACSYDSQRFLNYKLERVAPLVTQMKIPTILETVLGITVPYAGKLTAEEIIELRQKRKSCFNRFRAELRKLAIRVKSSPWDTYFQTEVQRLVKEEILPEVRNIRRQMREIQPNLGETAIKAAISQIPYIGLLADAYDVYKTWQQKRKLEKNSLYFLTLL